ncbi:hypothetical protein MtrunA17_Chr5g0432001 [Medicago truncatula]|uniref:Uncharacterized protein n=1 Tax=Medicago truncatula TaxID=3880 RepID=A0A396HZ43_MEDTR|nr:hypothetical protein MtrunA17_Chr5g0432001 [Medicago truncatula]
MHSMPPKPAKTSSKDLEEALQATEQRLENSITASHHHFTEQLEVMNTRLNQQQHHVDARDANLQTLLDECHETLVTILAVVLQTRQPDPPPPPISSGDRE